jgi:hypothetical protein
MRNVNRESRRPGPSRRTLGIFLTAVLFLGTILVPQGPACASEYDRDETGNPVHIAGTVLYPAGIVYEYLWLKPAHWLGERTPFRQLLGQDTFNEAYD